VANGGLRWWRHGRYALVMDKHPNAETPAELGHDVDDAASSRSDPIFEVSISGVVPPAVLAELGDDVEASSQEMRTVLTGHFRDQSDVHGFLLRLRAYALEVVEVRRIASVEGDDR
jgi:hypothetical protein